MKKSIYIVLIVIITSCISQKNAPKIKETKPLTQLKLVTDTLTREEKNIVNDFLDIELASERYKNYINLEIIVIEEAGNGFENLRVYEYAYRDFHSDGNESTAEDKERLGWILDTLKIKELKNKCSGKKEYRWKISDIKNHKVSIMKNETFVKIINSGEYTNSPVKLILRITKPLIIDNYNAFISFRLGVLGLNTINSYTALMKKTNGKWKIGASYWDGSFE